MAELTVDDVVAQIDAIENPPKSEPITEEEIQRQKRESHESLFAGVPDGQNAIYQRIPNWISGMRPKVSEFDTAEDLVEIEWVKWWSKQKGFVRFILDRRYLMVETRDCKNPGYFIGYVRYPGRVHLSDAEGG